MHFIIRLFATIALTLSLSACHFTPFLYKQDVTQGTVFSENQINQLAVGMPREQVLQILGTPPIKDPFHQDIDTYIFSFKSGSENRTYQRRLSIQYAGGVIAAINNVPITVKGN